MIIKPDLKFTHKEWVDENNKSVTCQIEQVDYQKERVYFRCLSNDMLYWCRLYWFKRDHYGKRASRHL